MELRDMYVRLEVIRTLPGLPQSLSSSYKLCSFVHTVLHSQFLQPLSARLTLLRTSNVECGKSYKETVFMVCMRGLETTMLRCLLWTPETPDTPPDDESYTAVECPVALTQGFLLRPCTSNYCTALWLRRFGWCPFSVL